MNSFTYLRAESLTDALDKGAGERTQFIGGGTNLLDLMKEKVALPNRLVDITRLPMKSVETSLEGGLRLGALVSNADVAYHPEVERRYPLLSKAILAGASPQLRNMATTGGNLLQRTRCYYFYDTGTPCNKRLPGSGCSALHGVNRMHAILGQSESCIAVHPSDMCVALAALEAVVHVTGKNGERRIPFADFHRLPGEHPDIDTTLQSGELITAVELPPRGFADHYEYIKLRDRTSYAFALISVAAALELEDEVIKEVRLALGGVAHKPWRSSEAQASLIGRPARADHFDEAARILLEPARGYSHNSFKIELARRAIVRALGQAAKGQGQPA